jgi:hypothetical protein
MTFGSGPLVLGPDVADWQTVAVVAQPSQPAQPDDPGGRGEDFGKSSPVGLLVLLLFFIAVAFLVRSMTKHLKRVPASFDKPADETTAEPSPESQEASTESPAEDSVEEKK